MYAIIETGGKQYKVKKDDIIFVEKLTLNENDKVDFKVIAVSDDNNNLIFGNPYLDSANVSGTLLENVKGKKITVFTYKPKKHSKRKLGHRQPYSKVRIESISI
jgi:large subunit ribosomal protein L21